MRSRLALRLTRRFFTHGILKLAELGKVSLAGTENYNVP